MCLLSSKKERYYFFNTIWQIFQLYHFPLWLTISWFSQQYFLYCLCMCSVTSVVSDSLWPHGLWPARLLCPWGSPGKNTGVGSHSLLQGLCPTWGSDLCLLRLLHCRRVLYHWATVLFIMREKNDPRKDESILFIKKRKHTVCLDKQEWLPTCQNVLQIFLRLFAMPENCSVFFVNEI